jgi:hypothetical protein
MKNADWRCRDCASYGMEDCIAGPVMPASTEGRNELAVMPQSVSRVPFTD